MRLTCVGVSVTCNKNVSVDIYEHLNISIGKCNRPADTAIRRNHDIVLIMHTECSGDACSRTYNLCKSTRGNVDCTTEITSSDPPGSVSSSPTSSDSPTSPTCPECPTCQTIKGQPKEVFSTIQPAQHPCTQTSVNTLTSQTNSHPQFLSDITSQAGVATTATTNTTCTAPAMATTATYGKHSPFSTSTPS